MAAAAIIPMIVVFFMGTSRFDAAYERAVVTLRNLPNATSEKGAFYRSLARLASNAR
jgi:hypothetical protein